MSIAGLVVVFKDYSATTEGVVQTAYVSKGESSKTFLSRIMASLAKNVKSAGNTLGFRLTGPSTAAVTGRVGSTAIAGQASVSFTPVASAHGSEVGIVAGYWAPTSQLGGERRELASIGACYGPERGTLSRFVKDQAFGYTLPVGWTVGQRAPTSSSSTTARTPPPTSCSPGRSFRARPGSRAPRASSSTACRSSGSA